MLKSIVNGAEQDIVRIPMKGKNLVHANSDKTGSFLSWKKDDSTFTLNGSSSVDDSFPFSTLYLKAGTYTLSIHGLKEIGSVKTGFYLSGVDTVRVQTNRTYTIMNDTTVTLRLVISVSDVSYDNEEITVMFNTGSTALPYEPYGYQNGWEIRDNQDRLIWGREDELQTTTGNLLFKGYSLPVKVNSLLGNTVQNGTPSPDNIVVPEFCGVRTGNLATPLKEWVDGYVGSNGKISSPSVTYIEKSSDYLEIPNNAVSVAFSGEDGTFERGSSGGWRAIGFYDSNKNFVSRAGGSGTNAMSASVPESARFMRISCRTYGSDKEYMLNLGSTALPYEPYGWAIEIEVI